jgi:hypothetical protein
MDTREIPADDPEQQWITKYRKALEAASIPIRQSRWDNFYAAIATVRKSIAVNSSKILTKGIHPAPKFKRPPRSVQPAANGAEMRSTS